MKFMSLRRTIAAVLSISLASVVHADVKTIDVPAGDLVVALESLAKQAGVEFFYQTQQVQGFRTQGVRGNLSPEEAVSKLLEGTSLILSTDEASGVLVITTASSSARTEKTSFATSSGGMKTRIAQASEGERSGEESASSRTSRSTDRNSSGSVGESIAEVTVYARGAVGQSVREIPQSLTTFTPELIEAVSGANIGDVLRFLPATTSLDGDYSHSQALFVRGARASYSLNGTMPSPVGDFKPGLANVERIEVLMGPASVAYGPMQPGALINIVTKQPIAEFRSQVDLQAGSFDSYRAAMDVGGPMADRVRVRLNASYSDRGSPFDYWKEKDLLIAPVVEFDVTDRTLLTLETSHHRLSYPYGLFDGRVPASGTLLPNPNGTIPLSLNTSHFDDATEYMRKYSVAQLRLKHEVSDSFSIHAQITRDRTRASDIAGYAYPLADSDRILGRGLYTYKDAADNTIVAVSMVGKLHTGIVSHNIVAGIDYLDADRIGKDNAGFAGTYFLDAFAPTPDYSASQGLVRLSPVIDAMSDTRMSAAFLQDQISIGSHFKMIAAARYTDSKSDSEWFYQDTESYAYFPSTIAKKWSTNFGVLYSVSDALTFYASRNNSFVPRAPIRLRDDTLYSAPETALQYEVGVKAAVPATRLSANLAWFSIERPNVLTFDPVNPNFQVPIGKLTSKGVEFSVSGAIVPGWDVYAAYAYNPTEVSKSITGGIGGRVFGNAPKSTASLISRYEIEAGALKGWGGSLTVNYLGDRFSDQTNVLVLPAVTRIDLGLDYELTRAVSLGVAANNVTDEKIYNGFLSNMVTRNAGRNYMFTIKMRPELFR